METIQLLSVALGLAALAGINLYLTVFVTGLAVRMEWITLATQYQQLEILAHPAILIISGVLYFLEFFADKIPWVDSIWDSVHTVIRPIGGALIAVTALGDASPVMVGLIALLGGSAAAGSHMTKAGARVAINTSPEPFTNWIASLAEDAFVIGLSLLTLKFPLLALLVSVTILVMIAWLARRLWRWLRPSTAAQTPST